MNCEKFEMVLSCHCSPVLMGEKPANLVSFSKEKMPELLDIMKVYEEKLSAEGVEMEVICGCGKHYLVLVYRKDMLEDYLKQSEAKEILIEDVRGFRVNGGSRCKLCGYWKVYGDVEKAKIQFAVYDKCRAFMNEQLRQGYTMLQILSGKNNFIEEFGKKV